MTLHKLIMTIYLLVFCTQVSAGELPDEAQLMLNDLGTPEVQQKNNGKVFRCIHGGTKQVRISQLGNAAIFTADYSNCREPGSTRDGHYEIMIQEDRIIGKKSSRSINGELFDAARDNNIAKVRGLIKRKADVNYSETVSQGERAYIDEWTPVMWAAVNGNTELIKLLVKNGAWVNYLNSAVVNALWLAADNGHLGAVKELVRDGANINNRNVENITPLMAAAMHGHFSVVKYLIGAKADINLVHKDNDGDSALMFALGMRQTNIARLLIDSGADINIQNKMGITALMIAVTEGNEEMVKALLEKKADITAKTGSGMTALDIAVGKGLTRIVELLSNSKSIMLQKDL